MKYPYPGLLVSKRPLLSAFMPIMVFLLLSAVISCGRTADDHASRESLAKQRAQAVERFHSNRGLGNTEEALGFADVCIAYDDSLAALLAVGGGPYESRSTGEIVAWCVAGGMFAGLVALGTSYFLHVKRLNIRIRNLKWRSLRLFHDYWTRLGEEKARRKVFEEAERQRKVLEVGASEVVESFRACAAFSREVTPQMWQQLYVAVTQLEADFIVRMEKVAAVEPGSRDCRLLCLMRLGFSRAEVSRLLSCSRATVTNRCHAITAASGISFGELINPPQDP